MSVKSNVNVIHCRSSNIPIFPTLALMHPHPRQNTSITGLYGGYKALLAAPHRFSFNGKESDSEVKGEGNSLDFGMRVYDSRVARFASVDPSAEKYPWQSPYSSFGNSPLIIVDNDGGDNIIYLIVLPSTFTSLKEADVKDIISKANASLKSMGLKTEIRLANPENFDIGKIDKTDAVAVLGEKSKVNEYVSTRLDEKFGEELKRSWKGGADNPEKSENNRAGSSDNIIAIDASGLEGFSIKVGLSDEKQATSKSGALSILHGAGHNSGLSHAYDETKTTISVIMRDANDMDKLLGNPKSSYPNYVEVTGNRDGQNNDYVSAMLKRFGNNAPNETNKQSKP